MIPKAKIEQVAMELHQRVAQLQREKQEQLEAYTKQDAQKPSFSGGLWRQFSAWLSGSQFRPYERVSSIVTERG